jgi:NTP pyrophosphatase (non-canonical NTP hydrolase)
MENDTVALRGASDHFALAFDKLAKIIHEDNVAKGFWPEGGRRTNGPGMVSERPGERNVGEALMLVVTELAEGMEGFRKKRNDDHLPQFISLEVEIADAIIRLMDLSYGMKLRVGEALAQKLMYNRTRPHKHGKSF